MQTVPPESEKAYVLALFKPHLDLEFGMFTEQGYSNRLLNDAISLMAVNNQICYQENLADPLSPKLIRGDSPIYRITAIGRTELESFSTRHLTIILSQFETSTNEPIPSFLEKELFTILNKFQLPYNSRTFAYRAVTIDIAKEIIEKQYVKTNNSY